MIGKYFVVLLSLIGYVNCAEPDCNHSGVNVMKQIYHCCKHPDGHNEIAEQCANATGYKLPNSNEESILDITPESAIKGSCFSECIFNSSKFINNGVIDIDTIRAAIQSDHSDDPEYVKEMLAAFDQCHSSAQEKKAAVMQSSFVTQHLKDRCNPMPGVILSCAITKFFKNCPASRWAGNQQCNDAKVYLNSCDNKLG